MACNKKLAYHLRMHIDIQPKSTMTTYDGFLAHLKAIAGNTSHIEIFLCFAYSFLCMDCQIMI